ncbi:T9SS type A sorting domain-containing protein [bacterium]|nr:T9SS type A sorting domain-containing protein [bacterium]
MKNKLRFIVVLIAVTVFYALSLGQGLYETVNESGRYEPSVAKLQMIKEAISSKNAEWTAKMPGNIPELMPVPDYGYERDYFRHFYDARSKDVPDHFDWRDHEGANWLGSVKDQGAMGSCWAFGTCACIEPKIKIHAGDPALPVDLSESYLVNCSDAGSEDGGWQRYAAAYIMENGIVDEQCSPYVDYPLPCSLMCYDWESRLTYIDSYDWVFSHNLEVYKQAIMEGPLAASIAVYEDFFYYESGVYEYTYGELSGGHVVLICGWDNEDSCWIGKNSWGTDWGENGYFKIKWGECWIEIDQMSVEVSHYPPYGFPDPQRPGNSVVINHGPINFNWSNLDRAANYEIMVARDVEFRNIVFYETGLPESYFSYSGELDRGIHYWRARGCNDDGCGSWSSGYTFFYTATGIDEVIQPDNYQLSWKAFPNPFNSTVTISVVLPTKKPLNVSIYNLWGEEIKEFYNDGAKEGLIEFTWQPCELSTGIYLYKIETPDESYVDRLYYLK